MTPTTPTTSERDLGQDPTRTIRHRLHVGEHTLFVAEKGRRDGDALVFIHGGGPGDSSLSDFAAAGEYLTHRRLFFLDLPMFGESSSTPVGGPLWTSLASLVAEAIRLLDVGAVDLACSSTGGGTAIALAARAPELVRSIVLSGARLLSDPGFRPADDEWARIVKAWPDMYAGEGPTREKMSLLLADLEWHDAAAIPPETVDLRLRNSLSDGQVALGRRGWGLLGDPEDLEPMLPDVEARVLLLWGIDDPFVSPEGGLAMAKALKRGAFHLMPEASHHLHEEHPFEYALIVDSFLAPAPHLKKEKS